jgi:hypothetical protein
MHVLQAKPDLHKNRLSYRERERWIILHQRKHIGRETFVYNRILLVVVVNVGSQVRVIAKPFVEFK